LPDRSSKSILAKINLGKYIGRGKLAGTPGDIMAATKKSCLGCRALSWGRITGYPSCTLGYDMRAILEHPDDSNITPIPVDTHCPKPRTWKALEHEESR